MKKILGLFLFACTALLANDISELSKKMIDTHKNNNHVEKKLDKAYPIKGYTEARLNLVIEDNKRYLFVKNIVDGKYVYIQFEFKTGNNMSAFKKTRVKISTRCNTLVNNAYYKDCK